MFILLAVLEEGPHFNSFVVGRAPVSPTLGPGLPPAPPKQKLSLRGTASDLSSQPPEATWVCG